MAFLRISFEYIDSKGNPIDCWVKGAKCVFYDDHGYELHHWEDDLVIPTIEEYNRMEEKKEENKDVKEEEYEVNNKKEKKRHRQQNYYDDDEFTL